MVLVFPWLVVLDVRGSPDSDALLLLKLRGAARATSGENPETGGDIARGDDGDKADAGRRLVRSLHPIDPGKEFGYPNVGPGGPSLAGPTGIHLGSIHIRK